MMHPRSDGRRRNALVITMSKAAELAGKSYNDLSMEMSFI